MTQHVPPSQPSAAGAVPPPETATALLQQVIAIVSRYQDLETLLSLTLDALLEALGLDGGMVALIDRHTQQLRVRVARGPGATGGPGAAGGSPAYALAEDVVDRGQSVFHESLSPKDAQRLDCRALASLPIRFQLLTGTTAQGVLQLYSATPYPWPTALRELLSTIAQQLGVAIDKTLLHAQSERERRRSWVMIETDKSLAGVLSPRDVITIAFDVAAEIGAEWAEFLALDENGELVEAASSHPAHAEFERAERLDHGYAALGSRAATTVLATRFPALDTSLNSASARPTSSARASSLLGSNPPTAPTPATPTPATPGTAPYGAPGANSQTGGSTLAVPVTSLVGRLYGLLLLHHGDPAALDDSYTPVTMFLAAQMGAALARADRRQAEQRRQDQMQLIEAIGRDLSAILDLRALVVLLARRITALFGYYHANIALVEGEEFVLFDAYGPNFVPSGEGDSPPPVREPIARGVIGHAITTGRPYVVNDVARDPYYIVSVYQPNTRSELAIPLTVHGRVVAVLDIQSADRNAFNPDLVAMFEALAVPLSIAVENARLYDGEQQRRRQAEVLRQVSQIVGSSLSLQQVLERIIEQLQIVLPYDSASIQLLKGNMLEIIAARTPDAPAPHPWIGITFKLTPEIPNYVAITERRPLIVPDASRYPSLAKYPQIKSWIGVPLLVQDRVIGMITIDSHNPNNFKHDDAELALAFATQAAIAIENARLYEQAERERRELVAAREQLQEGLVDLAQRNVELLALSELSATVTSQLDLNQLLHTIASKVADTLDARICGIMLAETDGFLHVRASFGLPPEYELRWIVGPGPSRHWRVFVTGEPLLLNELDVDPSPISEHLDLAMRSGIRKAALVALTARGQTLGVLTVAEKHTKADFTQSDLRLLSAFANQAAVAIDNARLYEAEQQRRRQAEVLREVAEAISSTLSVDAIFARILDLLQGVIPFDTASILSLEGSEAEIVHTYGFPDPERVMGLRFSVDDVQNPLSQVMQTRAAYIVPDAPATYASFREPPHNRIRTWMGVPLIFGDQLYGLLSLDNQRPNMYTGEHAQLAMTFANQVAAALQNARLFEETKRRAQQLTTLNQIGRAVSSVLTFEQVLEVIYEQTVRAIPADSFFIALYDAATEELSFEILYDGGQRFPREVLHSNPGTFIRRAIEGRRTLRVLRSPGEVEERQNMIRAREADHLIGDVSRPSASLLFAPLLAGPQAIGVISVQTYALNRYTVEHEQLLSAISNQVAIAIEHARLFEETQRRAEQLATLNEISRAVSSAFTLEQVLTVVHAQTARVIPLDAFFVVLYDARTDTIRFELLYDNGRYYPTEESTTAPANYIRDVITRRQPKRLLRTPEEIAQRMQKVHEGNRAGQLGDQSRPSASLLFAPLLLGEQSLGVISAQSYELHRYTVEHEQLLSAIANQVALAIEHARLYEAEQQRRRQAEVLREVAEAISSTLKIDEVLNLILDQLQKVVAFDSATVQLLDGDELVIIGGRGFAMPERVLGLRFPADSPHYPNHHVLRTRAPHIVLDAPARYASFQESPAEHVRTWLGVPLLFGAQLFGMLALDNKRSQPYTEDQAQLALAFANQAAAALQNARLFEETQRRAQQLATLNEIGRAVSSALTVEQVLEVIYQQTVRVIPLDAFFIALYDRERDEFAFELIADRGERYTPRVRKPGPDTHIRLAVNERRTHMVLRSPEEVLAERPRFDNRLDAFTEPAASMLYAPLLAGEHATGVISAQSYEFDAYTPEHSELLSAIANQVAIAIEHARLYQETQYRVSVMTQLYDLITLVRSTLDLDEVLQATTLAIRRLFDVQVCGIGTFNDATAELTYPASSGPMAGRVPALPYAAIPAAIMEPLQRGEVVHIARVGDYPTMMRHFHMRPSRGAIHVPILAQGQTRGVISLMTPGAPQFTPEQHELLTALANQVSMAMVNAQRFAELQNALTERERTQDRLIRSESLAAVGQLVAGVAHELNNPLASVSSLIQSTIEVLNDTPLPEPDELGGAPGGAPLSEAPGQALLALRRESELQIVDDLHFSLKEIRRAKDIVGSLLDLSRQSQNYTEQVSLNVVVQDALRILHNKYKHRDVVIGRALDPDVPTITGNFAHLGQVTLNIIQNALEILPEKGGAIEVGTGWDNERHKVWFYCRDNGPGIPDHVLPNIFNPFFTTKEVGQGTGLGLYISHEIVKRHNGEIVVETALGHGTTFRVELPL